MITIVIFKAYDKTQEKNFYNGEGMGTIHKVLSMICKTYVPLDIIRAPSHQRSAPTKLLNLQSKAK